MAYCSYKTTAGNLRAVYFNNNVCLSPTWFLRPPYFALFPPNPHLSGVLLVAHLVSLAVGRAIAQAGGEGAARAEGQGGLGESVIKQKTFNRASAYVYIQKTQYRFRVTKSLIFVCVHGTSFMIW